MNLDWKRIALAIGFLCVIGFFIFLLYYFFFRSSEVSEVSTPSPEIIESPFPTGGLRDPRETSIPQSTPSPFDTPFQGVQAEQEQLPATAKEARGGSTQTHELDTDRNTFLKPLGNGTTVATYNPYEKKFFQITPEGKKTELSQNLFPAVDTVTWTQNGDKAIISHLDNTQVVYDFAQQKQIATLPPHWRDITFSGTGEKIAFKSIGDYPENRWIAIANDDGSNAQLIEPLGEKAGLFDVNWSPAGHIVATFREGVDQDRQKLFFVGVNGENFQNTIIEGRGFESIWSPAGDRLLYSVFATTSDYKPELWIVDAYGDAIGQNRRKLGLQTWVDKCTFINNSTAYCAVPKTLRQGAGIIRSISDIEEDVIYKVDLATGEKKKVVEPAQKHTIEKLVVSKDEAKLFFTDKDSGRLYEINLR